METVPILTDNTSARHGSRAAVTEEERGDMLSSPSDDEVGGFQSAIRVERASASGTIKHGSRAAVGEEEGADMLLGELLIGR
ncbi:MAG TPA: hypothetical protein VFT17_14515 [Propionibacteriaceae bacterium]|nr:hypothetical protein [Propionibacteriaceae bacterium]